MSRDLPTIDDLRRLLDYDEATGTLYWRRRNGKAAGHRDRRGYLSVRIKRHLIRAHRVVWAIFYGAWPSGDVDHIDGDRANNRITNLREATRSQNLANSRMRRSISKGASWDSRRNNWRARITVNYREVWLGTFETEAEAGAAYARAARNYFGEFARTA